MGFSMLFAPIFTAVRVRDESIDRISGEMGPTIGSGDDMRSSIAQPRHPQG
jgi:hypothetical protein